MDSKRQLQTGEMMKRHLASVFQEQGYYIYQNAFVTVTTVRVTPDMSQAKVYLSIFNADDKELILQKISNHTHSLKQSLVSKIKNHVRRIPQIYFYLDETIDEIYKVNSLFNQIQTMYPPSVSASEEE